MEIKKVIPSGYCKGVISAIEMAKKCRLEHPDEKIYVLGMIVHNRYVTEALTCYDIITLDEKEKTKEEWIDYINDGIIIFTAHGISEKIKEQAKAKGLKFVDASCSNVIKTQNIIKKRRKEGYTVLYIGKNHHPEAEAVLSIDPSIHLIDKEEKLNELEITGPVFVTNQTTMSLFEVEKWIQAILKKWPDALIEEEICHATSSRQKAIMDLKDCDLLYVVGDPKSNNTNQLKRIGLKSGIPNVQMIETASEIKEEDLLDVKTVYVTAGASTPTYITNQVIDVLKHYAAKKEIKKSEIVISDILSH